MSAPLDRLIATLANTGMTRFFRRLFDDYPDLLMKDQTVEEIGPDRLIKLRGRWVTNFGSDSFLGFDQDERVKAAIERGVRAGMESGARCTGVETVLDEMEATRYALDMGHEGDVIVVCVDHANDVWKELQRRQHGGASASDVSSPIDTLDDELEEMVAIEVDG